MFIFRFPAPACKIIPTVGAEYAGYVAEVSYFAQFTGNESASFFFVAVDNMVNPVTFNIVNTFASNKDAGKIKFHKRYGKINKNAIEECLTPPFDSI